MAQNHILRVETRLTELSRILQWFYDLSQEQLPRETFIQCQTLLAESFTNAVRHAHQDKSLETPIEIEVDFHPHQLEIRIWDYGPQFDLDRCLRDALDPLNPEAMGGRGLWLISRLSDSFSYHRLKDGRNCLAILKQIPQQTDSTAARIFKDLN